MSAPRLRCAVVGYGFIASQGHVPAYLSRTDVELVAVADVCAARREAAARALPNARIYTSHQELLLAETDLDFIDICTPPAAHAPIAQATLAQGLHVLCEKPLTTNADESRDLIRVAQKVRRVLFPVHNYVHAPVVRAIRAVLASGRLGAVKSVSLSTFRHTHAVGTPEWKPDWRRDRAHAGGGITMDHGSHSLYLIFEWLGGYPSAVSARMFNLGPKSHDTEDTCSAVLSFPNGLAQVHLTWTAGVRKVIYAIQCEGGAITVDDDQMEIALMSTEQGNTNWTFERSTIPSDWMDASHATWFGSLIDRFKKAISENDFVGRDVMDALHCVKTIEAAYQSSMEGGGELVHLGDEFSHPGARHRSKSGVRSK